MINFDYLATLDFSVPWQYRWQLLQATVTSLWLAFIATVVGAVLGTAVAIVGRMKFAPVRWLVLGYVEFFRNTPLLVQLTWIHFVVPLFTGINTSPFMSGTIALTLNVTAYFSETARAGINSVGKGQWEAARALGLHWVPIWSKVVLPQAFRVMIPPIANMVISIFKATAILSILAVDDLLRVSSRIANLSFKPVEVMTAMAIIYFVVGSLITFGTGKVEARYGPREGK